MDTRTAIGDQQRESVLVPGPLVDEIDVQPLDFGDELIKSVECGLTSTPKPTTRSPAETETDPELRRCANSGIFPESRWLVTRPASP